MIRKKTEKKKIKQEEDHVGEGDRVADAIKEDLHDLIDGLDIRRVVLLGVDLVTKGTFTNDVEREVRDPLLDLLFLVTSKLLPLFQHVTCVSLSRYVSDQAVKQQKKKKKKRPGRR